MKKHLFFLLVVFFVAASCQGEPVTPEAPVEPTQEEIDDQDEEPGTDTPSGESDPDPVEAKLAFPGAEGAGRLATGGRGGDVYVVTSLADDGSGNTPGTLRYGIKNASGPRTIVFNVSGTIKLTAGKPLAINVGSLTIAGQTAPEGGITIKGRTSIKNVDDMIIRHIRFRSHQDTGDGDALTVVGKNIIIDHCSVSWASDEVLSTGQEPVDKMTVQHTLIYEGLEVSYHYENDPPELQNHSMGSLFGSTINNATFTIHHCLYAHNRTRNPKFAPNPNVTITFDFVNNVLYNWKSYAGYTTSYDDCYPQVNYVNNYLIAGKNVNNNKNDPYRALDVQTDNMKLYLAGNYVDPDKDGVENPVAVDDWSKLITNSTKYTKLSAPNPCPEVTTQTAIEAYNQLLAKGGARWWDRDVTDARILNEVKTRTGERINWPKDKIGSYAAGTVDADGYPIIASVSRPAGWDTDGDGMPDAWETSKGLNPNVKDGNLYTLSTAYTNLEMYLDSLCRE